MQAFHFLSNDTQLTVFKIFAKDEPLLTNMIVGEYVGQMLYASCFVGEVQVIQGEVTMPVFKQTLPPLRPGFDPRTGSSGKAGSCLPLVGSLQYTTLANSMYWFPLPFQLPVVI